MLTIHESKIPHLKHAIESKGGTFDPPEQSGRLTLPRRDGNGSDIYGVKRMNNHNLELRYGGSISNNNTLPASPDTAGELQELLNRL